MSEQFYFIWSVEHDGWWKPDRNGYTEDFSKAGQYSKEEAYKISAYANWSSVCELPVPASFFEFHCLVQKEKKERKV